MGVQKQYEALRDGHDEYWISLADLENVRGVLRSMAQEIPYQHFFWGL